jgi:hypothetical protein
MDLACIELHPLPATEAAGAAAAATASAGSGGGPPGLIPWAVTEAEAGCDVSLQELRLTAGSATMASAMPPILPTPLPRGSRANKSPRDHVQRLEVVAEG